MYAHRENQKLNASKNKNKENNTCVTYKSLNQQCLNQTSSNVVKYNNPSANGVVRPQEFKPKIITASNFRTTKNSPRRVPSLEKDVVRLFG